MRLVLCSGCERHVKSSEPACPFCGASLEGLTPRAASPMTELSRAAAIFIGAATLVGCGKEPAPEPVTPPAPTNGDAPAPAYGPPPVPPEPPVSASVEPPKPLPPGDAGQPKLSAPAYGPPPQRKDK